MFNKKECVAMLLAGGQGSRLYALTQSVAKPAVPFGAKYRIIDFPLSNCINSGIDTVGVLTQYQPLVLNEYIGNGQPWDLDRIHGGVHVLPPYQTASGADWYSGTANAIYQNIAFVDRYDPEYVVVLSGDHIYKMDYNKMLEYHKAKNADATIAVLDVPKEEASRFGIMITDEDDNIIDFEEKPKNPRSTLASMGIYIFTWKKLKAYLIANENDKEASKDFGKNIIPDMREAGEKLVAYRFDGYWKDVGTLHSYWEANMELIDIVPVFNLYEEFWKIYTKSDNQPPQYIADTAQIERCIIGDGSEIYGRVRNCVIGPEVIVEEGAEVYDSILMQGAVIKKGTKIYKSIIAQDAVVGENCTIGVGEYADSQYNKKVYCCDLVTVAEGSEIPDGVTIGKNVAIAGKTAIEDYPDGNLVSGGYIIKGGEEE